MCGENQRKIKLFTSEEGSSPRVRGKQLDRLARRGLTRLIPACAGKTAPRFAGRRDEWAHPRVCGENYNPDLHICVQPGSSPRVRGKRNSENARDLSRGLIPACAGKTGAMKCLGGVRRAHPRVCGENTNTNKKPAGKIGSSPRVRGKLAISTSEGHGRGLIPACAGKTWGSKAGLESSAAHPRVCGENSAKRRTDRLQDVRLIPACAGKTATLDA